MEKFEISVLLFKDLISTIPNNSTYWSLLGNSYLRLDLYNLSLHAYEKASELGNYKQGWIFANIGNLYSNKNLYSKAEENLKKALELSGDSEYSHNRLSTVYKAIQDDAKKLDNLLINAKAQLSLEVLAP